MAIGKLMAKAASGAAIFLIAVAPALAKSKGSGNYSVGCLTQDTILQASEGIAAGTAAATVTIAPASLWPPNHKLQTEDITMTLPDAASSAVDVSLQVTDITDDQLAAESGKGGGCGQPTSKQGQDWSPTDFSGLVDRHARGYHRLAGAGWRGTAVGALREAWHPHLHGYGDML